MTAAARVFLPVACFLALLLIGPGGGHPLAPVPALAFVPPTLTLSSAVVHAGDAVTLNVAHFVPGGYTASIQFDGVNDGTFAIPPGGDAGPIAYTIPLAAVPGAHDVSVCVTCGSGDIEQRSTVRIVVTNGILPVGRWNGTVWGIEVTQGVRGSFAMRDPLSLNITLTPESVVHVANRRTVVRVYPWMAAGASALSTARVRATLRGVIDGVPVGPIDPVNWLIDLRADRTFEELRNNLDLTWNFELPAEWTALSPLGTSANLDLYVSLTPYSTGECDFCVPDNNAYLNGVTFQHVGRSTRHALTFRPFRLQVVPDPAHPSVIEGRPTLRQLQSAIASFYEILPIGHAHRGILLYPWRDIDWTGRLTTADHREVFDEAMIRRFPAAGGTFESGPNEVYAFMRGSGSCAGHASFVGSAYLISSSCWWPSYVSAHELSHCIGRPHAGGGHTELGPDPDYPGSHGQVEATTWGLDSYARMLLPPVAYNVEFITHDFMSYGPEPSWMSLYGWNQLTRDLGSPGVSLSTPASSPSRASAVTSSTPTLVTGTLDANGQVTLSPFFGGTPPKLPPAGELLLHFEDGIGNTLADRSLPIRMPTDPEPDPGGGLVAGIVDVPNGWSSLRLAIGPNTLSTLQRSPSAPTVALLQPNAPFSWGASGTQLVKWQGSDADNDALTFRVVGRRNGTETHILASDVTGTEAMLDLAQVPGGGAWELTVEASDGFNTGVSQAMPGTVAAHAPQPLIVFPADSTIFVAGEPITAEGVVADDQDESDGSNLSWWLDGTLLGSGASRALPSLAAGTHALEARASNSAQLQGSMTETLFVVDSLGAPTLLAPPDAAGGQSDPTDLTWSPVPGASSYRVQVAYDPGFSPVLAEFGSIRAQSFRFDGKPGYGYAWRVRTEHAFAPGGWSAPRSFTVFSTAGLLRSGGRAQALRAYPNPIAPGTTFAFALERAGLVRLAIYDVAGRQVRVLHRGMLRAGLQEVRWDGRDSRGRLPGAGVYVARLAGPDGEGAVRLIKPSE